ncbi:MAG: hypothetical protein RJA99_1337 [Pseudomonadota bacterium]|jgi:RND family efflux transporter MFP subunit
MNGVVAGTVAVAVAAVLAWAPPARADTAPGRVDALPSEAARAAGGARASVHDGTVEAVRQTVVSAQVPGAVVAIDVKAGDTVRAGQPLMRLDARAAEQAAAASDAQVAATRATLMVAQKEVERQRQLFAKEYISRAALERAEAQVLAAQAQLDAQAAQAGAARTQTGFHRVVAPYAGVVAEVPVALGDMAMPGRPLLVLYDPAALRVTVPVPQGAAAPGLGPDAVRIELAGAGGERRSVVPTKVTVLPTVDAGSRTVQLRLDLPGGLADARPGAFARVTLAGAVEASSVGRERVFVPAASVVRRAELAGVYVLDPKGHPVLRQVRLGPAQGAEVEVLAGVRAGERVVLDPQAAAKVR